jgi:hypothetical protein
MASYWRSLETNKVRISMDIRCRDWRFKVWGCALVTFLSWILVFDWCVVGWESKNKHHKCTCLEDIGLHLRERHNPYLATPGHIRNPRSHPQPPVTSATPFSNGVPPVYIHPSMSSDWRHPSISTRKFLVEMGNLRTLFQVMVRSEKHQIIDHGWFSGILNPSPNFTEAVRRPGALEAIVSYIYAHPSAPTH